MEFLDKISDKRVRQAVRKAYRHYRLPLHFIPATISGLYHPKDERGIGGLKRHTWKLCWLILQASKGGNWRQDTLDEMLCAAYFHDLGKVESVKVKTRLIPKGTDLRRKVCLEKEFNSSGDKHPLVSARMVRSYLENEGVEEEFISTVERIVLSHMGRFCPNYPQPRTWKERLFSTFDYIVSREEFHIKRSFSERVKGRVKKWILRHL